MKKTILIILFHFFVLTTFGQTDYDKIFIKKSKVDTIIDNFKGIDSYQLDNYQFLVGIDNSSDKTGIKLIVLDNDSIIFKSDSLIGDYYSFNLYFFENKYGFIILGEKADEGIWGYNVFLFDNEFRQIGSLRYAGIQKLGNTNGPSCSLIPFIEKISKHESFVTIELKDTEIYKLLINGNQIVVNGQKEEIIIKL